MMNKIISIVFISFLCNGIFLHADEGMWLLSSLNELDSCFLKQNGMQLSLEDIYSLRKPAVKDAIVIFDKGCTGAIISEEGLVLTNHHCGYDAIQYHSSVEKNYLEDGFWAGSKIEELPTPGLTATFLVEQKDVTERIIEAINDSLSYNEKQDIINQLCLEIEEEITSENPFYEASVKPLYEGNIYILFVYKVFTDVRFVGAPPSSIGKFGADTDNWMWPRHTGDFSMFRIYSDKDGNPADYSPENIPYKPLYHIPVSLNGYEKNDFAFVLGYPGRTERYMTSYELKELTDIINANRIKIRGIRQDIILEDMMNEEKIRIQYASKYSRSTNYWKFSIGQNAGLERLKVINSKIFEEKDFMDWVNQSEERKIKYSNALPLIEQSVTSRMPYTNALQYINECFKRSTEIFAMAQNSKELHVALKNNKDSIHIDIEALKKEARDFYKDYNAETDKKIVKATLKLYKNEIEQQFHPEFFATINKKYKGDMDKYVDYIFKKSIFVDSLKLYSFLNKYSLKVLEKDPAFQAAMSINKLYSSINKETKNNRNDFNYGRYLYMAGLIAKNDNNVLYPDANFTMRFTYGSVQDYFPKDAVYYNYYTTLTGVMEKEDPNNWEFVVPEKLKQLYMDKDYGQYGEKGILKTCFLTNNDITGGNSGSPVLNGKGELIGLAFDGNWEAMSGDIAFEPELQRCINVDIRYILFIIDKFAGAKHIIDEMTIIK